MSIENHEIKTFREWGGDWKSYKQYLYGVGALAPSLIKTVTV